MDGTMRALTYFGKNDVRVVEKPRPKVLHPEDALLRVTTAAICGSDLHLYHAMVPDTRVGTTFGHEVVGVVEEVGPEVGNLRTGDRVVVPFNIACGRCFYCSQGEWAVCEESNPYSDLGGMLGYSHTTGGYDGGQAEYVRVPFATVGPRKVPESLTDAQAVMLADIFPTGHMAAEMASIRPGDTVAVFGAGPVGLFAMKSAKGFFGAGRIIAIDKVPYRLDFAAREVGAETVDFTQVPDVVAYLKEITDGRGPDSCIDAVGLEADGSPNQDMLGGLLMQAGSATAFNWALNSVRPAGTVSVVGVYGPPWNHFVPLGWAMNRNVTVRMGQTPVPRYIDDLMARVLAGEIDPSFLVSHEMPLDEAPKGYEIFERKLDGAIKVLLHP